MRRAVIYSRYSTDRQNERSIDDQIALWETPATRAQFAIVARYSDRAVSGASMHNRPGIHELVAAARAKTFDVVLTESLDRLSRDQGDLAWLYKELTFRGIEIIAHDDGKADQLRVGVRGIIGAMYLTDVAAKVRRGMAGTLRAGKNPSGRAYGYAPVPGQRGELVIDEAQAMIVRRIFAEYVAGRRPRASAAGLNRDGIPAPRGGEWNASTINGQRKRGCGILINEIYIGVIVWNRARMVKDPATGKRLSRMNDAGAAMRIPAPHLRIIDDATWNAAQAIKQQRGRAPFQLSRKPRRLLSGLVKCGICGSSLAISGADRSGKHRLRCTRMVERGTCRNGRRPYVEDIESRVLAGLKEKLRAPHFINRYVESYNAERRRLAGAAAAGRSALERRAAEVGRELNRAVDAIVKGIVDPETMRDKIHTLEAERDRLAGELANAVAADRVVTLHPTAISRYHADVDALATAFARDAAIANHEAGERVRALIARVVVTPVDRGYDILLEGRLAELLQDRRGAGIFPDGLQVVAEDGFEPPTHGL